MIIITYMLYRQLNRVDKKNAEFKLTKNTDSDGKILV